LAASRRFLEGFSPAALTGDDTDAVRFAFVTDAAFTPGGDQRAVAVAVREDEDHLVCTVAGHDDETDLAVVQTQVERMLSLDIDGSEFPAVGARDKVIRRLQSRFPGLRPVLFSSPYEAAAWTLIGRRIRIDQAARIKSRLSQDLGEAVEIDGVVDYAFPWPHRLASLEGFPGLPEAKIASLQALGERASTGILDATYLRKLKYAEAITLLQEELPGVGPFSAELILLRGAGISDRLPVHEPRLGKAIAYAYGLRQPPLPEEVTLMGKAWRPYRTWVAFLLRAAHAEVAPEADDED
jgi:DNA-3-methyladenine glycosylase II